MELIDQHAKQIMEECKRRARSAGLRFGDETLEYIATNQDLVSLEPRAMIPTLYDYWVHDVEVLKGKGIYEIYPHNAYETVINTRPAISFYNDNNPDWLNVMIFYHVLGHIDCFQNNVFFQKTWDDDFCGQALAGKRLLNRIREEQGEEKRWVDYVIEFTRGIDNLVGFHTELNQNDVRNPSTLSRTDFYFGEFLKGLHQKGIITTNIYFQDLEKYNQNVKQFGPKRGKDIFFEEIKKRYPEFAGIFEKLKGEKRSKPRDIIEYIMEHSEFLAKAKNAWIKQVMQVVRQTSLIFQPQIRTKILNEGWASYWHQKLFLTDQRMNGHEIDFAKINSGVMTMPRIGTNPYVLGCWLLEFIENLANKGKLSYQFQNIQNINLRTKHDDKNLGEGMKMLFNIRTNLDDFGLVNFLSDDDFQDFVNIHKLFVVGSKIDPDRGTMVSYIKSRNGRDYRNMVLNSLYHPPYILIEENIAKGGELYLNHQFEGRSLFTRYIPVVLTGLQFLWGNRVKLETTEFEYEEPGLFDGLTDEPIKYKKLRVVYTLEGDEITKETLGEQ